MAKFVSRVNPVSFKALKRKPLGSVVVNHNEWEDVRYIRIHGGWKREGTDFFGLRSEVVSSVQVARECNMAIGCKDSWARVY